MVYAKLTLFYSQGVIIQHHVATLLYLIFPFIYREDAWLMGACLIVEINTWLLIARRVFNKQGFTPWVGLIFAHGPSVKQFSCSILSQRNSYRLLTCHLFLAFA